MKRMLGLVLAVQAPYLLAEACDCQTVIGACQGSIEFVKAYGSKPSFGADLVVHSSEKGCSKVEYQVGGTPYQTLLVNRNSEPESVFGTSPVTPASVQFKACKVCARTGAKPSSPAATAAEPKAYDLSGSWASVQTCSWGSGNSTMTINYNQSTGSVGGRLANAGIDSGAIRGNHVQISASNWLGNRIEMTGEIIDSQHMRGTYTQSSSRETCSWEASKAN
ncbi:hypothetical protein [Pseudomonas sp. NPDC007930]|uniref:hypothetical protein n=1 Tax=Pseudomonas sp. NPDC007930 TaxID=3364417 RepID=UPI0036E2A797